MSISKNDNSYKAKAKTEWREWIYSNLSPTSQSCLTTKDGKLIHKWLEPVGTNAVTFSQLLSTNMITESQLIGIDLDSDNISNCKQRFPQAEFHAKRWDEFCAEYQDADIGVIIMDLFNAAYGKDFQSNLRDTLRLAKRCKDFIGELLLVVNIDRDKTYRGEAYLRDITPESMLVGQLESYIEQVMGIKYTINIGSNYVYKQHSKSANMLSYAILL